MMLPLSVGIHTLLLGVACVAEGDPVLGIPAQLQGRRGDIIRELGPLLSKDATIVLPLSSEAEPLLIRAATPRISPDYKAIVEVATEQDVQQTIKYANLHKTPFLAVSGGHGWPTTLNGVKAGIQINMRKMNHTTLKRDGRSASIGAGALQHEVIAALFSHGKRAVTGLCECVSAIGPLLGGGHSMIQWRYGFAADNLVSARVVLADGRAVDVAADKNSDLFWGLRGAGHNFGIVTSFVVKAYDAGDTWTLITLTFTQDKLEVFFETWNMLEKAHPDRGMLVVIGIMARNDDIDPENPVINLQLIYEGRNDAADLYAAAFRKLEPKADSTLQEISWGDLFTAGGFGLTGPICRKNQNILGYPNSLDKWDVDAMRAAFGIFSDLTSEELFKTSAMLLESYGQQGARAVPEGSNAVAPEERRRHLLTSPILWWMGDDAAARKRAEDYGAGIQAAVRKGAGSAEPHAYVNYATGCEDFGEVYGREAPRRSKLKALKAKWDPQGQFGFYMPIE
ncbi:hypothetical protein JDV02_000207 [Purpureocillium takamizusanense]|uniref:FAD-binding PCMH-type domain-containing protein n=1 Tax=Purpureocillium takamizusanense TaxID=2060973 RepID=A0A9Q8Q4B6_9HYPO|nr:uncharacterized protein JDV02_000207 [Purpureocillium takamizusanense]UNI13464.1 hypothetical protein JDV02_000207 [Purpureocillium takamizusanense]